MDRYGRQYSITEVELDLVSPYHGFGRHDPHAAGPPPPIHNTVGLPGRASYWRSFFSPLPRSEGHNPYASEPSPRNADSVDPLISPNEITAKSRRKLWDQYHGGWRTGVALGALGAIVVLIINVCLLIWIKAKYHVPNDGAATVFEGSCSHKTQISVWCHLAINVCSTLLLSASNNAMQVLSAPTRADVDKAHRQGFWLDIGVTSIKNLRVAHWQRVTLWAVLALSSIPLHLFYNSVISTTLSTTDYMAVVTTEDFMDGAAWNHSITATEYSQLSQQVSPTHTETQYPLGVPNYNMISKLQHNATGDLQRLDIPTCIRSYNHEFVSDWRNVLLISNATNMTNYQNAQDQDAVVALVINNTGIERPNWFCAWELDSGDCSAENIIKMNTWYISAISESKVEHAFVKYCLAESIEAHCKVTFNVYMLLISVICNAAKLAAFLLILLLPGFKPLITVGDAIASFLTFPDPVTSRIGAPTVAEDGSWTPPILSTPWNPKRCHWFCGASLRQWFIGTLAMISIFVPALVVLLKFTGSWGYHPNFGELWGEGFGAVHTDFLVTIASSEMGTALVSNSPQLLLSVIYVSYNLLMTSMMMTKEYNDFAVERKPLRVSEPRGQQRSSYYLQLPYRYAVPLIVCSGTLHWLISQSLFQVKRIFYDNAGNLQFNKAILACGWSPIAVCFTLGLGGVMILVLFVLGCRKLNKGMPVMRSNSLDIAAACHPPIPNENMALEPVSYGAADVKGYRSWHACFTNQPVVPLTRKYDGTFRLNLIADDGDELDLMLPSGKSGNESDDHLKRRSRASIPGSF